MQAYSLYRIVKWPNNSTLSAELKRETNNLVLMQNYRVIEDSRSLENGESALRLRDSPFQ